MATITPKSPDHSAGAGSGSSKCPRCQQLLVDPHGLGWCQECGYCRSLGPEQARKAPSAKQSKPTKQAKPTKPTKQPKPGAPALPAKLLGVPVWCLVALLSMVAVAMSVYLAERRVELRPLSRALWATIQIGGGMALLFIGKFTALLQIAPEDPNLTFKDAILPGHIYGPMLKRLPATRWSLYLICWGMTLIVTANVCIGGLGHWFKFVKGEASFKQSYYPPPR
jgi:hypothetical protein